MQSLTVQQRQYLPWPQSSLTRPRNKCRAMSTLLWKGLPQSFHAVSADPQGSGLLSFYLTAQRRVEPKGLGRPEPGRAGLRAKRSHPIGRGETLTHPDIPEPRKSWSILMCSTHAVRQNPPVSQTQRNDSFHYLSCGHHLHNWMASGTGREKTMANPMVIDNRVCNCSQRGSLDRHINAHIHTLILTTLFISDSILASLLALA